MPFDIVYEQDGFARNRLRKEHLVHLFLSLNRHPRRRVAELCDDGDLRHKGLGGAGGVGIVKKAGADGIRRQQIVTVEGKRRGERNRDYLLPRSLFLFLVSRRDAEFAMQAAQKSDGFSLRHLFDFAS